MQRLGGLVDREAALARVVMGLVAVMSVTRRRATRATWPLSFRYSSTTW